LLFKSFDLLSSIPNSFELAFLWCYIIFVQVIIVLLLIFACAIKVIRKILVFNLLLGMGIIHLVKVIKKCQI